MRENGSDLEFVKVELKIVIPVVPPKGHITGSIIIHNIYKIAALGKAAIDKFFDL